MFTSLGARFDEVFRKLRSKGRLTEKDVDLALRELRLALLEADVALEAVRPFLAGVKAKAIGEQILRSLTPGQQVVKLVHEQLIEMLGGEIKPLAVAPKPPTVILLAGLQGSGKTTTAAKLGAHLKKKGGRVLLVAADLERPAAIKQLEVLAEQSGLMIHSDIESRDPVKVARDGLEKGRRDADWVIVDTAGRLHIDTEMMDQVARVHDAVAPHEVLFVLDAMTGQDALVSAKSFSETLPLTGIIITKLDGDARGGAALSATTVTGVPVRFAGTGERVDELEPFYPDRIAGRILGMGDVLTLIEKASETVDKDEAESQARKLMEARFTLEDFLEQMSSVRKMGGIGSLLKMLPGVGKGMANMDVDDGELDRIEAIIRSMTPRERRDPKSISGTRRVRIASGSGTQVREVNDLLKQFEAARKMMKQMSKLRPGRSLKQMQLPPGFS